MTAHLTFGQWLKRRRLSLGLTQDQLGRLTGYAGETIRKVEADERRPSAELAARLAVALAIEPAQREEFARFARDEAGSVAAPVWASGRAAFHAERRTPHNLPSAPTPLVGREADIAAVKDLLARHDLRVVTLTGVGGVGKTRLALQVGADLVNAFPDGVYFVNLAPVLDAALVASAIARSLDMRNADTRPVVDSLKERLHDKRLLLVLDNFEHVLDAGPLVAELVAGAPMLKALVTSRTLLRLRGEQNFPVPPLSVPDPAYFPGVEEAAKYAAVDLFLQRARDVQPDFALTQENVRDVVDICRRLDGLPLAIELAASRMGVLTPHALLSRLGQRLALLTAGQRDAPARQQTLRATLAWSYDLLSEDERRLFRRLGVFVGGFTLAAAAVVAGEERLGAEDSTSPISSLQSPISLLDGLASLVDKSLLQRHLAEDPPRFIMLETIREYAVERLVESGERDALHQAHAGYYLHLITAAAGEPRDQSEWMQRLRPEENNLRAALRRAEGKDDLEMAMRLLNAMALLWESEGYLSEWRAHAADLLARPAAQARQVGLLRAALLKHSGRLASFQSDLAAARQAEEAALALYRSLGDSDGVCRVLAILAMIAWMQGDYALAYSLGTEGLTLARQVGDKREIAHALGVLAMIAREQADYRLARAHYQESLRLRRELGDEGMMGEALMNLGAVAAFEGDAAARSLLGEALTIFDRLGYQLGRARTLHDLGFLAARQGDDALAGTRFAESLALFHIIHDRRNAAKCLEGLAGVAQASSQGERAARLFGAAEAVRERIGAPLPPSYRVSYEQNVRLLRAAMDEAPLAAAWAEGRAMTLDEAVAYALGADEGVV